ARPPARSSAHLALGGHQEMAVRVLSAEDGLQAGPELAGKEGEARTVATIRASVACSFGLRLS
ncbi:MAG: hypothetical protein WCE75_10570, partial [Terracidiphilus sp.]